MSSDIISKARLEIGQAKSVACVMEWALKNLSPLVYELIQQDEYSLDLVLKVGPDLYLAYDSN